MSDPAKLDVEGKDLDLAVISGTVGPDVIDIRKLYAQTGKFTYDPGFTSTASVRQRDHLYRRRRGRAAPPRLPDRPAGRGFELHGGVATCC